MVYFSKLKLYGFKSFVDKVELDIGPGLNGIVGPNGCGKSNLVEALRWVMGEKSAKNMRGGGMEDVIFAGTSKRPARNMAEVTVVMNNEDATAPAPFNVATEIEINRRIVKDKGSQYRVNGKAVRARDVNLLFADTMTGANSPALVSQGRITEIIIAKPSDRRRILEESAGISGLHTRRHEAELRLRAADQNLTRLNDTLGDMRSRLGSLKRQARQAERYKELSDSIRRLELALSWSEWSSTHAKIKSDRTAFSTHNDTVQDALQETKRLTVALEAMDLTLPQKRKDVMEAQVVLQNFRISLERLEQDIQTKTKGLQDSVDAKSQLETDSVFTQDQLSQITIDLKKSQNDIAQLMKDKEAYPGQIDGTEKALSTLETSHLECVTQKQSIETAMAVANESQANLQSQSTTIGTAIEKNTRNIEILNAAITDTTDKLSVIKADPILGVDVNALDKAIIEITATIDTVKQNQLQGQETLNVHKGNRDDLVKTINALEGEYNGLQSLLSRTNNDETLPQGDDALLSHIQVEKGYEKAFSVAMGQWAAMAGIEQQSAVYWSPSSLGASKTVSSYPTGTEPLSHFVNAPDSLGLLLDTVGIVDDLNASYELNMGQMVVARDGAFIRWDGLHVTADAMETTDTTSLMLEQKNRVAELDVEISQSKKALAAANTEIESAQSSFDQGDERASALKLELDQKTNEKRDVAHGQERLQDQKSVLEEKLIEQKDRLTQNKDELTECQSQYDAIQSQLQATDGDAIERQKIELAALSEKIQNTTVTMNDARQNLSDLRQAKDNATRQIETLQGQGVRYEQEVDKLNTRLDDMTARQNAIDAKILAYKSNKDDNADDMREGLLTKIVDQDQILQDLTSDLEILENDNKRTGTDLREAEAKAALARENRAVAQTNVANAESELQTLESKIAEQFELSPQALEERVFSLFNDKIPSQDDLQGERETVMRQRDAIGPVNLRAAIECSETEAELADMEGEYNDLIKAIEQLRGGIAKLNREAKDRLAIAFQRVDQHFQTLFEQLFGGGKAYLQMISSDDPLEAGLEIYAQPPGKALQKLSLLSGGEQTLTAIALIFGMFLTNPSPICVLDEIDAPLDDANVDRVCGLMETISRDTDTRFIVITHHRMTMARMDRLYGVTMSERGVSQLVSVDMALQEELELAESA